MGHDHELGEPRRQSEQPVNRGATARPSHHFGLIVETGVSILHVNGIYIQIYLVRIEVKTRQDGLALTVPRTEAKISNAV